MADTFIYCQHAAQQNWKMTGGAIVSDGLGTPALKRLDGGTESPKSASATISNFDKRDPESLEEELFNNLTELKIYLSTVSMHLDSRWRKSIFRQLDNLLGIENWEEDCSDINPDSFATFMRFIIYAKPAALPSMGVSARGNVLAAWLESDKSLSVEFLTRDIAHAIVTKETDRSPESASWSGHVASVKGFVEMFGISSCLTVGNNG